MDVQLNLQLYAANNLHKSSNNNPFRIQTRIRKHAGKGKQILRKTWVGNHTNGDYSARKEEDRAQQSEQTRNNAWCLTASKSPEEGIMGNQYYKHEHNFFRGLQDLLLQILVLFRYPFGAVYLCQVDDLSIARSILGTTCKQTLMFS